MTLEMWKQVAEGLFIMLAVLGLQGWLMFRNIDRLTDDLKEKELLIGNRRRP